MTRIIRRMSFRQQGLSRKAAPLQLAEPPVTVPAAQEPTATLQVKRVNSEPNLSPALKPVMHAAPEPEYNDAIIRGNASTSALPLDTSRLDVDELLGTEVHGYVLGPILKASPLCVVRECVRADNQLDGSTGRLVLRTQYFRPDVYRIKQSEIIPSKDWTMNLTEQEERLRVFRLHYELKFWSRIHHENTLPLLDWWEGEEGIYAISPFCHDGTLLDFLAKRASGRLDNNMARAVIRGAAKAVDYLHSDAQIIHGDIKLEHVYLQRLGATWWKVMLGGFGLSQLTNAAENEELFQLIKQQNDTEGEEDAVLSGGSIPYCSPERLAAHGTVTLTKEMDIWSLGVLAYAVVCGRMPFEDEYEPRLVAKIMAGEWEWPSNLDIDDSIKECIDGWLRRKPERRWPVRTGLRGEWLRGG